VSSVQERTFAIIAEQLRVPLDSVTAESHLIDDLNADSLDVVDLTIAIEEEFSDDDHELEISEDDAAELQTVQDVINFLAARGIA
jgi:acyl carrier protein